MDDSSQAQVDACSDEGRRDGERYEVCEEGVEVEDIVVQHDTSNVADYLTDQAAGHPDAKGPGSVPDAESELSDKYEAEDGGE